MENTVIIAIIALFIIVILFLFTLKPKDTIWKKEVISKINGIRDLSNHPQIIISKTSVIEADKLLDYCMKEMKVKGETMGERLKNAKSYFDKNAYNNIWEAHKVRNQLVHEVDFSITNVQVAKSVDALIKGIRELLN
jgi:hypothetical protein